MYYLFKLPDSKVRHRDLKKSTIIKKLLPDSYIGDTVERDWNDFKSIHSNKAGAREAFETCCEDLFRKVHKDEHVQQVEVRRGDGGIDIFIGELGVEPITVIQCKFFIDGFGEAQKSQVRKSFKTAIESIEYELEKWILCIPITLDLASNTWWCNWKAQQIDDHSKDKSFIELKNGNELISLLKQYNLYNRHFNIEEMLLLEDISIKVGELLSQKSETTENEIKTTQNNDHRVVLFTNYKENCESYYKERDKDHSFNSILNHNFNIWVHGSSGCGKTSLVIRNLLQNKFNHIYCDLSPITITSSDDIWREIIDEIELQKDIEYKPHKLNVKSLCEYLIECRFTKEVVIVIDEMSCCDKDVLSDFLSSIVNLVSYYNKKEKNNNLLFIISTLFSPSEIIDNKLKALELFQLLPADGWDGYIEELFDIQNEALGLNLSSEIKNAVIEGSMHIPRLLSIIMRKSLLSTDKSLNNVNSIIEQSRAEYL